MSILTDEGAEKLIAEFRGDPDDLCRRLYGNTKPTWQGRNMTPPNAAKIVSELLTPVLTSQLGYDGSTSHHVNRQAGFFAHTENGWEETDIDMLANELDEVFETGEAEAQTDLNRLPAEAFSEPRRKAELRLNLIKAARRAVTGGGMYRGRLVAALRGSDDFDLDDDAVTEIVLRSLAAANHSGRAARRRRVAAVVAAATN
jgi:hypothetical protein